MGIMTESITYTVAFAVGMLPQMMVASFAVSSGMSPSTVTVSPARVSWVPTISSGPS